METMMMAVDQADKAVEEEVQAARAAILDVIRTAPSEAWTAYELKTRARNGWSSGAMGIALRELIDEGVLTRGSDLRVRLSD
jgi:hypothetical protein